MTNRVLRGGIAIFAILSTGTVVRADSLARLLDDVVTRRGLQRLDPSVAFVPVLTRLAVRAADYPTTATTPDFAYVYDPETGAFERTSRALGSIFLERAETVGRGSAEVGVSTFLSEADSLDGRSLTGVVSRFQAVVGGSEEEPPSIVPVALRFDDFSLRTAGILLSATYGLTDRWDVNVLAPLLVTTLDVKGRREATLPGGAVLGIATIAIDETRVGLGDLLWRTKYRVGAPRWADVAIGLTLRAPTGKVNDFQGLADWTVTPFAAIDRDIGPHNVHLNLGVETNASVLERSRVRYGAGASIQLTKRCSLVLDFLGSSGISSEDFLAGTFTVRGKSGFVERGFPATAPRTDIVDSAVGFKVRLLGSVTGFVSVIIPLTTDGLRADIVPLAGFEKSF